MKKKDILYLVLAVAIFGVAGYIGLTQLSSKPKTQGVSVEVVDPIAQDFNQDTLAKLNDPSQIKNFAVPVDLTNGLGNPTPIGSFQ